MMAVPSSLARDISPPPPLKRRKTSGTFSPNITPEPVSSVKPTLAAVEAGKAKIDDHLAYFKDHLSKASRETTKGVARLSINEFAALYHNNQHQHGHHFVIHQHNHPRAGVHYDLRLQFSESSSMSFAVPKGLPGNPNSRSIGRMAIETRVHNYWNHLIESASYKTGSLLIWDTGTYEVLPRKHQGRNKKGMPSPQTTDEEHSESDPGDEEAKTSIRTQSEEKHENEKLIEAFKSRYIRLRLHGPRLPRGYTIILRLPSNEIIKRPTARRKRRQKPSVTRQRSPADSDNDSNDEVIQEEEVDDDLDTDTDEDTQTRATNAYPGSMNDIGSVHQRHWFMQLDRHNSGFLLDRADGGKGRWIQGKDGNGCAAFLVRGRDHERSVVTGRLAREVESDEGVEGFVGRGGWVGIEY
ncbi:DNA polymerase ligase-domain-containing protein [Paraphoma chrysanthemicola]|uniref:DNA polymerase ligase-domain-containing protein n=1 Tax=Paraphoma chrysanthemicola TaxID=798071 RepID=A0A8K0R0D7_9PLEO|nr:DNA polymerase ligase-domain-containing protein [Paraphoma chrysanthemicola]